MAIGEEKADEIFDLMEKFAGYGFNKSHAAAYSLLAYHTGWLKVHYTAEFYCANMTVEMDDTDKLKALFEDAQKHFNITFEPPDVNRGVHRFEPVSDIDVMVDGDLAVLRYRSAIDIAVTGGTPGPLSAQHLDVYVRDTDGRWRVRWSQATEVVQPAP